MLSQHEWTQLQERFNPRQPLRSWDDRRCDENLQFFVSRDSGEQLRRMADSLTGDSPRHLTLVGQRGGGKTTELFKLIDTLKNDYFCVQIDMDNLTDVSSVNLVEVLWCIGAAVWAYGNSTGVEIVEDDLAGLKKSLESVVARDVEKEKFQILWDKVAETATTLASAAVGASAAGPVGAATGFGVAKLLFGTLSLSWGLSHETITELRTDPKMTLVLEELNRFLGKVQSRLAPRQMLVVIDGLEKVDSERARSIFAQSQMLGQVLCNAVYVMPPTLFHSPEMQQARENFDRIFALPNVKLHEPGDRRKRWKKGYELLRRVARVRVESVEKESVRLPIDSSTAIHQSAARPLNLEEVFDAGALDELVRSSGGIMREFIRLCQMAIQNAKLMDRPKVGKKDSRQAIVEARRHLSAGLLSAELLDELRTIHRTRRPTGTVASDRLLQNLYVLVYENDDLWCDIHPIILPLVRSRKGKGS